MAAAGRPGAGQRICVLCEPARPVSDSGNTKDVRPLIPAPAQGAEPDAVGTRFGAEVIPFTDPDGMQLEL